MQYSIQKKLSKKLRFIKLTSNLLMLIIGGWGIEQVVYADNLGYNNYTNNKHYCQFAYINHNLSNDISSFGVNMETGKLENLGFPMLPTGNNPGAFYTHPNGNFVYVLGGADNSVTAYKINRETGQLTQIQKVDTGPGGNWGGVMSPKTGAFLYVNNNAENNIIMFKVDPNTGLLSVNKTELYPDGIIPNAQNANGNDNMKITSNLKYAYVTNYNSNNLTVYNYNANTGDLTLALPQAIYVGGIHPRQLTLSPAAVPSDPTKTPQNKQIYIVNQASNNITQFDLDENELIIQKSQTPTVSTSGVGPAGINIEGTYQYIYNTNWQSNSIGMFHIDQDNGLLTPLNPATTPGSIQPKGIYTNLGYAYVTNFSSNTVSQFKIGEDGTLTKVGSDIETGGFGSGNITFSPVYESGC